MIKINLNEKWIKNWNFKQKNIYSQDFNVNYWLKEIIVQHLQRIMTQIPEKAKLMRYNKKGYVLFQYHGISYFSVWFYGILRKNCIPVFHLMPVTGNGLIIGSIFLYFTISPSKLPLVMVFDRDLTVLQYHRPLQTPPP